MSKTLKTYPDGSQLTTTGAAAALGLITITGTIGAVAATKWHNWRDRRFYEKYLANENKTPKNK